MKIDKPYVLIGCVIAVAVVAFYFGKRSTDVRVENDTASSTTEPTSTTTTQIAKPNPASNSVTQKPTTQATGSINSLRYTNSEHGFSISYPKYAKVNSVFTTFHEIGNNWRVAASAANQGKAVSAVTLFSVDQGVYSTGKQKYPLYFLAETRIGVSQNTKDCYELDGGDPNQKVTNVTINGVAFKKFSSSLGIAPKYTNVESYRTIRNNKCYAIEQIKTGTTFKDDLMQPGISDSALEGYYTAAGGVVTSFRFTN